ncbi:MAG: hypothetical protein ACRD1I_05070 [Terriglobia bacterium]
MSEEIQQETIKQSKRPLSRRQLEQRRAAAEKATGPRTLAGKVRAAKSSLQHGKYAGEKRSHLTALYDSMVELGEDPEEFSQFQQGMVESLQPSGPEQAATVREIAWMHWERQRLERAQAALLARRVQELEIKRQRKSLEISQRISAQLPALQQNLGYIWAEESPEKFQKLLELLDQLKQCVDAAVYAGAGIFIDWIYGPTPTTRGAMMKLLFTELAAASSADVASRSAARGESEEPGAKDEGQETRETATLFPQEDDGEPLGPAEGRLREPGEECLPDSSTRNTGAHNRFAVMKLRRELEAEIASITQQYWLYQRQYVDVTPTMRAECLVPTIEQRWLMRQLAMIDRSLDRKVRLMMDQRRMEREEEMGPKES